MGPTQGPFLLSNTKPVGAALQSGSCVQYPARKRAGDALTSSPMRCRGSHAGIPAPASPNCPHITQLPPGSRVHPESPRPQARGGPFNPPLHHRHHHTLAGERHGVVGDSSQPSVLFATLRNGHTLVTTPLSPQTLKIVRTAELSPFIVFIAPTDKAEQVGGRVARQSTAQAWQGARSPLQQPWALSLLHISFFLSALISVVQESRATSPDQTW